MTAPTKNQLIQALINQGLFYVCDLPRFVRVRRVADVLEINHGSC